MTSRGALVEIAPVAQRLSKTIPTLGSDRDGEILAAVRGIGRILTGAGLSWFALAAALGEIERLPSETTRSARKPRSLQEIARWCYEHDGGRLTHAERDFVSNMVRRLAHGGMPSLRQQEWLQNIYAKLRNGGRS